MELVHEGFVVVGSGGLQLLHVCGCPRDECVASGASVGSYPHTQPFWGSYPSLRFATVSDEQLDRELRKRLVGTGEAHARTAFLLPKVSAAALCITESRSAFCCPGFQGMARDFSEVCRVPYGAWSWSRDLASQSLEGLCHVANAAPQPA